MAVERAVSGCGGRWADAGGGCLSGQRLRHPRPAGGRAGGRGLEHGSHDPEHERDPARRTGCRGAARLRASGTLPVQRRPRPGCHPGRGGLGGRDRAAQRCVGAQAGSVLAMYSGASAPFLSISYCRLGEPGRGPARRSGKGGLPVAVSGATPWTGSWWPRNSSAACPRRAGRTAAVFPRMPIGARTSRTCCSTGTPWSPSGPVPRCSPRWPCSAALPRDSRRTA